MSKPTLLVLAAGMGSRYGGLKQIDPMGPSGETILDYSVFDALRAGFGKVVFIIRPDFEQDFREKVAAKFAGRVPVDYAFQTLDKLPAGQQVMLKLTIPSEANFYKPLIDHPKVMRVVALSGGYSRDEACDILAANHGMIASFSRALSEGLTAQMSDAEFTATLDAAIAEIYAASIT